MGVALRPQVGEEVQALLEHVDALGADGDPVLDQLGEVGAAGVGRLRVSRERGESSVPSGVPRGGSRP